LASVTGLVATDFPGSSIGLDFRFTVSVYTNFSPNGVTSEESEDMTLAGVPDTPLVAPTRGSSTDDTQIAVDITTVSGINGAAITSYHIVIDDGAGGSFVELQGESSETTATSATYSTSITAGAYYRVKYRAKNIIGYSDYSDITYILAATIPDTPDAPTISISGTDAVIVWTWPYNGGSDVTSA
jgi:hypothetical protein